MARSLTFNSIDLSTYGLIVSSLDIPFGLSANAIQLPDRSYSYDSHRPPLTITARVAVAAATHVLLRSYLSSINGVLNQLSDKQISFDNITDRYWSGRLSNIAGDFISPFAWQGDIIFNCNDPLAYDVNLVSNNYNIDADPKTIVETAGGTAYIKPIYSLTAGANFTPLTLKLENLDIGEDINWSANMAIGQVLSIDVTAWVVALDGVASMSSVTGKFPQLRPGANNIQVTGFGTLGTLNIEYRNRYS